MGCKMTMEMHQVSSGAQMRNCYSLLLLTSLCFNEADQQRRCMFEKQSIIIAKNSDMTKLERKKTSHSHTQKNNNSKRKGNQNTTWHVSTAVGKTRPPRANLSIIILFCYQFSVFLKITKKPQDGLHRYHNIRSGKEKLDCLKITT